MRDSSTKKSVKKSKKNQVENIGAVNRNSATVSNKSSGVVNEVYYRVCEKMLKLQRNTPEELFDRACNICSENRLYKADSLQNVITMLSNTEDTEPNEDFKIVNQENTRGQNYYQ